MADLSVGAMCTSALGDQALAGDPYSCDLSFRTSLGPLWKRGKEDGTVTNVYGYYGHLRASTNPDAYKSIDAMYERLPIDVQFGYHDKFYFPELRSARTGWHPSIEWGFGLSPLYIVTGAVLGFQEGSVLGAGVGGAGGLIFGVDLYVDTGFDINKTISLRFGLYPNGRSLISAHNYSEGVHPQEDIGLVDVVIAANPGVRVQLLKF